jgi:short-subunit dehydrogenase
MAEGPRVKFPHKVVAITGASSGIGAELAAQLGALGCSVGLMARRADVLTGIAAKIEAAGGRAFVATCDVADFAQVKAAVDGISRALGPIDCMVANAGIGNPVKALEFDAAVTENIYRVNVLGMTNTFYAVLPGMLERKRGHLVGVSSLASFQGMPEDGGYAGSKAAQRIHCEGLRIELRGTGVDVTAICPGFIRTPMTDRNEFDMPVLLEVDVAARKIIRAIAKRKRVYAFPWQLWWLIKLGQRTPRWLYDAVISSQTGKATTRKQKRSTEI